MFQYLSIQANTECITLPALLKCCKFTALIRRRHGSYLQNLYWAKIKFISVNCSWSFFFQMLNDFINSGDKHGPLALSLDQWVDHFCYVQKLVVKPDQLIKRRGKLGLIKVKADLHDVQDWIKSRLNQEIQVRQW